jgi:hypothetical protein
MGVVVVILVNGRDIDERKGEESKRTATEAELASIEYGGGGDTDDERRASERRRRRGLQDQRTATSAVLRARQRRQRSSTFKKVYVALLKRLMSM